VNPIYDEMADRRGVDVPENPITWEPTTTTTGSLEQAVSGQAAGVQYAGYRYYPDPGLPSPNATPPAETAGEQDHTNPWFYAGEDADRPRPC
jgi:hypothetical protein